MINYTKAISLDPNQSYAYERRGMLKFALADYFGCIEDLNVSINLHSNKGEVYYIRGLAKFYNSDNLSACEDLRTAGELGIIVAYDAIKSYCN